MIRGWVKEHEGEILAWAPRPIYRTVCQPPGAWRRAEARDMPDIERFVGPSWMRVRYAMAMALQGKRG